MEVTLLKKSQSSSLKRSHRLNYIKDKWFTFLERGLATLDFVFLIYVNRSELFNNHHFILDESKKLFCFSEKHFNANCNTSVISLAVNPSYKGYSHAVHPGVTKSNEYIFSLSLHRSFPPPLTLNTLIYLLISRLSLTRDDSPPETNQHTHTQRLLLSFCSSKLAPEELIPISVLCKSIFGNQQPRCVLGKPERCVGSPDHQICTTLQLCIYSGHILKGQPRAWAKQSTQGSGYTLCPGSLGFLLQPNKHQLSFKVTPHYAMGTRTPGHLQHRLRSWKHGLLFLPL